MLNQRLALLAALVALTVLMSACATKFQDSVDQESVYRKFAGEPINNVFLGVGIRDWQVVGPDTIRMELSRQRHVLVDFAPPCSSVLRSVDSFALISSQPGYLSIFDQVRMGDVSCRIQTIRELDYQAAQTELDK